MGNTSSIKGYINKVNQNIRFNLEKDEAIDNKLKELFPQYKQINNHEAPEIFIRKNIFRIFLQISEEENFGKIFEIFGEKDEKQQEIVTFDSIKYLYYAFTKEDSKIKIILISFLIFGNKKYLEENILTSYISKVNFNNKELTELFIDYIKKLAMIDRKKEKYPHSKVKEINIKIEDFIHLFFKLEEGKQKRIDLISNFHFLKHFTGISTFKLDPKNNNLDYYCDCSIVKQEDKKKYLEKENDLNGMKKAFDEMTYSTNKALNFTDFEKKLKENIIPQNLINLIIDYMKRKTFKDCCFFKDLKELFTNLLYNVPLDEKKKFLFKMISTINKNQTKLKYEQIYKYLSLDNLS